ncbi:MAG: thioredoxin [Bacteroidales bacterium]|nr:thioredoxin [Bacteroidales bacterium]
MQTTLIISGIVMVAVFIIIYRSYSKMRNTPLEEDHKKIITLTDKNFQQQIKDKIILVDFWASWCAPCRMMAPVLNDVANELNENKYVGKVNIEQFQSIAQKYNVRSIPTLILLKNGVEVNRFVGFRNKEFLLKQIQN